MTNAIHDVAGSAPASPDMFPVRLRGTSRWRRELARDARRWGTLAENELRDLDPFTRAACRYAAELELTATVYDLVHDGVSRGGAAHG